MKNIIVLHLSVFLLLIGQIMAQEGGTIENDCTNGTHTNWDPQYASPNTNDYKKNTFDWTQNGWSVRRFDASGVYGTYPLTSPFYATGIYGPFRNSQFSDFKPEDGWELIKQDLGYFYSAGKWDGGRMGNGQPGMPSDPGDPRLDGTKVSYIVLYNKYSSLLRVFAYLPNGCGSSAYNTIYVKLNLLNPNNYQFNPIGAAPSPYNMNYAPQVNGIFNVYNQGSIMQALDKQTNVSSISAPAKFGYCNAAEMFFADFQLAYDPCICTLQSGIEIEFYSNLTADFSANGKFSGTIGSFNTYSIAYIANGQGNVYGNNGALGEDFIASVFENGGSPQSMIQTYNNLLQVYKDKQTDLAQKAQIAGYIDLFAKGLSIASGLPITSLKSPLVSALGYSVTYKQALEYGSKGLNYLSANVKEGSAGSEPNLSIASGYMNLNGKINYPPTTYNGNNILIATPGSKDADIMPEYSQAISATLPNYPMYNEPVGLFTLMKTPVVNLFSSATSVLGASYQNPPNSGIGYKDWYSNISSSYSLPENIEYKLNPLVDESKSNIYIGLEIIGADDCESYVLKWFKEFKDCLFRSSVTSNQHLSESHFISDKNTYNTLEFRLDEGNNTSVYDSPFFKLGCINSIVGKYDFKLNMQFRNAPEHGQFPSGWGFCWQPEYVGGNVAQTGVIGVHEVRLVVLLDLTSKPDAHGKTHKMFQIQKYRCDVNNVTTDPLTSAPLNSYLQVLQNANNNLVQGNYSFSGAGPVNEIYSFGNILVNGNQYNPWSSAHLAFLTGEKEIAVQGEVQITTYGDDITLRIKPLPSIYDGCSEQQVNQVDFNFLSTYCANSEQYKANQLSTQTQSRLIKENEMKKQEEYLLKQKVNIDTNRYPLTQDLLDENHKIGVFPNPTDNHITINLFSPVSGEITVLIEDIMGKQIKSQNFTAEIGYSEKGLDLIEFANGVYLLKILDKGKNLIFTEKIFLSK